MEFRFSEFDGLDDNQPHGRVEKYENFVKLFESFKIAPTKAKVRVWTPAIYPDGYTRSKANVEALTGLVYDFDDKDEAFKERTLEALTGHNFILHSTYSNGQPGKGVRFRVVLPFETLVSPKSFKQNYELVADKFGWSGEYDKKLAHPAAVVFWPSLSNPSAPHFLHTGEGVFLKVDAQTIALHTPAKERSEKLNAQGVVAGIKKTDESDVAEEIRKFKIRIGTFRKAEYLEMFERLKAGKPIAEIGNRDAALQKIVSVIAFRLNEEQLTSLDEDIILDYLQPSIDATPGDEDDKLTREDAREKLRRSRRDALTKRDDEKKFAGAFDSDAPPVIPTRGDTYTKEEVEEISRRFCGGKPPTWVVQKNSTLFYLTHRGYVGPHTTVEFHATAFKALARAPISLQTINAKGQTRDMNMAEVLRRHGRGILEYKGSFVAREHTYDSDTQIFIAAVCPLRDLTPLESPEVDAWLRLLAGEHTEKFLDWVASVTDLSQTTCALYLEGAPRTGKSLFAAALSRLWNTSGPTEMAGVLGANFNAELLQCPLIMADEALPKGFKGESLSSQLRELVGVHSRTVNQKFQPAMRVEGAVRVVMAGNNSNLLQFKEGLTEDDMQAVAERILHVKVSPKAADFVAELGREKVRAFVENDLVARHALWLAATRRVVPQSRFLVSGSLAEVHTRLRTSSGHNPEIIEFIVTCLLNRSAAEKTRQRKTLFAKNGELFVSSGAFESDAWEFHVANGKKRGVPSKSEVMTSIHSISKDSKSTTVWIGNGEKARVWKLNTDVLLQWADDTGMDTEKLQKLLKGETSGPSANGNTAVAATEVN